MDGGGWTCPLLQFADADVPPAPETTRLPAHGAAVDLQRDGAVEHAIEGVILGIGRIADLHPVDPYRGVRDVAFDAHADGVPVERLPELHAGIGRLAGCLRRRGRRLRRRAGRSRAAPSSAGSDLNAAFANHPAHAAAGQIVHGDLIGDAGFRRPEEDAAVATPVGLRLHVELEIAIFLVRQEEAAAANGLLRAEDHPVQYVEVRGDAVAGFFADVPAAQVATVEDRREAVGYFRRGRVTATLR